MRTFRTGLIALLALLAASAPARADHTLSIHFANQWVGDDGILLSGTNRDLMQAELRYGGRLKQWGRVGLWLDGDWGFGFRNPSGYQFESSLFTQQLHLAPRLTINAKPWLVPQIRLGAGAAVGRMRLGERDFVGDSWAGAFSGFLTGGLEFLIPRPWMNQVAGKGVTAGLLIEAGYLVASPMTFNTVPASRGTTLVIPTSGASLGVLDLSGAVFRLGATIRF